MKEFERIDGYYDIPDIHDLEERFNDVMTGIGVLPESMWQPSFWDMIFTRLFGKYPNFFCLDEDGLYRDDRADERMDDEEGEELLKNLKTFKSINPMVSLNNIIRAYEGRCIVIRRSGHPLVITNDFIIFYTDSRREMRIFSKQPLLSEEFKALISHEDRYKDDRYFDYVTSSSRGFNTVRLIVKATDVDLDLQYNEDLPHQKILDFIGSDESGLMLLHGVPGTGKTTYIRYLMHILPKKHFLVLDSSVFDHITDSTFIELMLEYKDAVVILEDCESMVTENARNRNISTLLNLSDGIIGDSFNFKFICTFNTQTNNIDKALMRKGRMKVKYEFKELNVERGQALADKLGNGMKVDKPVALTEIYNYGEENGQVVQRRAVGFTANEDGVQAPKKLCGTIGRSLRREGDQNWGREFDVFEDVMEKISKD